MHLTTALENHLTSLLIITLILVDYARKYNTDSFQRFIFLQILAFAMTALVSNISYSLLSLWPEFGIENIYKLFGTVYYVFQILSFFYIAVFVDYTIFQEPVRSRKFIIVSWIAAILYAMLLIFMRDDLNFIQIVLGYIPAIVVIIEIISSSKSFIKHQFHLLLIFWGAISIGILADNFFGTVNLIWPCYSAALLYAYLLIVRTDLKIDALTGIGNRYAFNEFMEKLSRKGSREKGDSSQAYSVVMIDIDRFKIINDVLGHAEGDNALRDMATIIMGCIRHSDFAVRYGGDEFVLAVPAEYDIQKVMARIQESISIQNTKKLRPYKLEMSYGCDVYTPGKHKSVEEFIHHVDGLMYIQKEEHRQRGNGMSVI